MADAPLPPIMPHLDVDGAADALDFYEKAFDAVEMVRMPAQDGKRLMHAAVKIGEGVVMLHDSFPEYAEMGGTANSKALGKSTVTIHLRAPDVDKTYKQAIDAGATSLMPPADMFWGDRYAKLRDPFGHIWSLGAPIKK
ncbi:MAG: VOC family protein [Reyranellaceae bacterium]